MARFTVFPHVEHPHPMSLFSTDTVETLHKWLETAQFYVIDTETGLKLDTFEDLDEALCAKPLPIRDWSVYGDFQDEDEDDEDPFAGFDDVLDEN